MEDLEKRIIALEKEITHNQRDIETLANALADTQEYIAGLYDYLAKISEPEVHHHYYNIKQNIKSDDIKPDL